MFKNICKRLPIRIVAVIYLFSFGSGLATVCPAQEHADVVYHNGRIYTMDAQRSWAQAVAVKDGRFIAVGSDKQVLSSAGPDTEKIDLAGSMTLPGLHDAHFHLVAAMLNLECTPGKFKQEDLREILADCKANPKAPGYPWLIVHGMEFEEDAEKINNDLLNEMFPGTPALVRGFSGHNRLVNDKALELAGIDKNTPDPIGGAIGRDPETGEPNGLLVELAAGFLVRERLPPYPKRVVHKEMKKIFRELLSYGVTSIQDASVFDEEILQTVSALDKEDFPIPYVLTHQVWYPNEGETRTRVEEMIRNRQQYDTGHLSTRAVKVFLDGVPIPPKPTHVPIRDDGTIDDTHLLIQRDVLAEKYIEWDKLGLKIKMHTAADGSARIGLDAIEAARKANGDSGAWHEIVHAYDISDADLPRFEKLRAVAEMSPYFWHTLLGAFGYQFASLDENNALMTAGSDNPAVPSFNPYPPLEGMVSGFIRFFTGESLPIEKALELYTRNGAISMGRFKDMGSIEVGKIANMAVLDRNLLDTWSWRISSTEVLKTILDGKVVYEKK